MLNYIADAVVKEFVPILIRILVRDFGWFVCSLLRINIKPESHTAWVAGSLLWLAAIALIVLASYAQHGASADRLAAARQGSSHSVGRG